SFRRRSTGTGRSRRAPRLAPAARGRGRTGPSRLRTRLSSWDFLLAESTDSGAGCYEYLHLLSGPEGRFGRGRFPLGCPETSASRGGEMRLSRAISGLAVCAAVVAARMEAAGPWSPFGPPGGSVRSLALDSASGTLYAGTYGGGVFRSTDRGATWTSVAPEIRGQTVHAVALDPSRPQTVFAGTHSDGVWRTTDGGATWKRVLHGGRKVGDQQA